MSVTRKKFLIVGSGGRECAFALQLVHDTRLYAIVSHENPFIMDCVKMSGGEYAVGNVDDPHTVLDFAREHDVEYAFVNSDQPLANGVVDILLKNNFKAIGGTQAATRIEWDKVHSIKTMSRVCPEHTPFYRIVSDPGMIDVALSEFESRGMDVVVKPQGLTGGKGVKVMPEHLLTYEDCADYALSLLTKDSGSSVLLVEKLNGVEFTIMGITDGLHLVMSPASYDYPFRYEDDLGAGTGGMGCFTSTQKRLPFMTEQDLKECRYIMQRIIDDMRSHDLTFNGVLNGGFFKTRDGIKFMEFNGRFGDPEVLNILSVLEGSFSKLLISIWNKTLSEHEGDNNNNNNDDDQHPHAVSFAKTACVTKYLVAKEYPDPSSEITSFRLDEDAITDMGVTVFTASCIRIGIHQYETIKKSRAVAFGALSDSIQDASSLVDRAIEMHVDGALEYRRDIGSSKSLEKLQKTVAQL